MIAQADGRGPPVLPSAVGLSWRPRLPGLARGTFGRRGLVRGLGVRRSLTPLGPPVAATLSRPLLAWLSRVLAWRPALAAFLMLRRLRRLIGRRKGGWMVVAVVGRYPVALGAMRTVAPAMPARFVAPG